MGNQLLLPAGRKGKEIYMIAECSATVAIILSIFIVFMRAKNKKYAYTILPLSFVPMGHILISLVSGKLSSILKLARPEIIVGFDIAVLIFSCLAIGFFSVKIAGKKARFMLFGLSSVYILIFTLVLVFHTMPVI